MPLQPVVFDARPFQDRHEEPFAHIMQAVASLQPGQELRLINTFDPRPLEAVLSAKGFDHEAHEVGPRHWEVLFRPRGEPRAAGGDDTPVLDNRGIQPAEAGVRTLQTLHRVPGHPGLVALFDRDPTKFCAELERRGYACTIDPPQREAWRVAICRAEHERT